MINAMEMVSMSDGKTNSLSDFIKDVANIEQEKTYLADVEGDTASRAYSANEFMVRSDGFYKVTANIAKDDTITDSNTEKTTIGAVLTALLNA